MPDTHTVDVHIPIEASVAARLDDPVTRALAGRLVSRMLQPASIEDLFATMDALSDEARRRGLTDESLDVELAVYNAERREPSAPPSL